MHSFQISEEKQTLKQSSSSFCGPYRPHPLDLPVGRLGVGVAAPVILAVQGGAGARAARLPEIVPGGERRTAAAQITFRLIFPLENFLVKFQKKYKKFRLFITIFAKIIQKFWSNVDEITDLES